jgi:hypothetical protein
MRITLHFLVQSDRLERAMMPGTTFGRPTLSAGQRIMQVAVKLVF